MIVASQRGQCHRFQVSLILHFVETSIIVFLSAFTNAKESVEKAVGRKKDDPKDAWIRYYLEELKKSSSAQQVTVGALSGWTSGFIAAKFGRTAATAVGGTVLLLHVSYQLD